MLDNAIKYSERGGTVTLRAACGSLTVEDEESGISEEDLPRVFEPLYRGGPRDEGLGRGASRGAGLGLYVGRDLVERMGGTISVRSREGAGTAVRVGLPGASPDTPAG